MARTLFDIALAEIPQSGWPQGHLVAEISPHIFSYAVIDAQNQLLHLRFYELDARDAHERCEELRILLLTDPVLSQEAGRRTFIYNYPESQFIPDEYFDAGAGGDMLELLHGDLHKGTTLFDKVAGASAYNVYRVPADIHELLQKQYANGKHWHYYSFWAQPASPENNGDASALSVLFYPHRILVSAVKQGQLQLVQSYSYEAAEDVAYYLLNIAHQLDLSPAETPVLLSGMIDAASVLYTEIYKFFSHLRLETSGGGITLPVMEEYPAHYFSPLLKMATCVS